MRYIPSISLLLFTSSLVSSETPTSIPTARNHLPTTTHSPSHLPTTHLPTSIPTPSPTYLPTSIPTPFDSVVLSFPTLVSAVRNNNDGGTIVIGANIVLSSSISVNKNLIFKSSDSYQYNLDGGGIYQIFELFGEGIHVSILNLNLTNGHGSNGGAINCEDSCKLNLTGSNLFSNTASMTTSLSNIQNTPI